MTVLPAVLLTAACGLLPEVGPAAPQPSPSPSAPPGPDLPTLHELVRTHLADTWAEEVEYGGRCEALGFSEQMDLASRGGVCLALFADWQDSTVFVVGPPASEPFEALRLATPDGTHWELVENFVIEDPYAPGPEWLDGAITTKDDPAAWEVTAPTPTEAAETWLADRYLPLDCESTGGTHPEQDAWCPREEDPGHAEDPQPGAETSVVVTHNGEPRYRLHLRHTGDGWSLTDEAEIDDRYGS